MPCAGRDISRFILLKQNDLLADCDLGGAAHNDPVLGTMEVLLQRQGFAWVDDDVLDLESRAAVHGFVGAPRARHLRGRDDAVALVVLQPVDDELVTARPAGARSDPFEHATAVELARALDRALAELPSREVLLAKLAGVGSLEAQGLRAESVDLDMSGLGGATVHATRAADVDLSGMGSATVYGNPGSRNANTNGMGKVSWK